MLFATAWNGLTCGLPSNTLPGSSDLTVLTPYACTVTLNETPGIVTTVALPAATRAVRLWVSTESVRVALDGPPSVPGESNDVAVLATEFTAGDTVLPGEWYVLVVEDDSFAHTVQLSGAEAYQRVLIVVLLA